MSLVTDPLARAHKVSTELQAARLKEELEVELIYNEHLPDGWEDQAEQAIKVLNDRFADLDDVDTSGGKRVKGKSGQTMPGTWSPKMSSGAKRGAGASSSRPAGDPSDPRGDTPAPPRRPREPKPTKPVQRPAARSAGGRGRKAFRQTGIPAAASSGTRTVLQLLGGAIGLTFLYLLLRNSEGAARGRSAVELAGQTVATAAQVLIAPVNPLSPNRAQQAAQAAPMPGRPANRPASTQTRRNTRTNAPSSAAKRAALL